MPKRRYHETLNSILNGPSNHKKKIIQELFVKKCKLQREEKKDPCWQVCGESSCPNGDIEIFTFWTQRVLLGRGVLPPPCRITKINEIDNTMKLIVLYS